MAQRNFAPRYETGEVWRRHLRGQVHILKWQLFHAGAFNLSLIHSSYLNRIRELGYTDDGCNTLAP
jgi:hypothetical protein